MSCLRVKVMLLTGALCLAALLIASLPTAAQAAPPAQAPSKTPLGKADLDHVAKELSNPLTSLWSLTNEFDFQYWNGDLGDRELQSSWNLKPVMPLDMGHGWVYVNRPTVPVVFKQPYFNMSDFQWDDDSGLGDIQYLGLLGKNFPDGLVLAGGITTIFPTATHDSLGMGKWQAGPALVAAVLKKKYILGALYQHWWSFAGQDDRDDTNLSALQVFYFLNFPGGWQVGGSPVITANWMADQDNRFNVPLGIGVSKVFRLGKLPIKIGLEYQKSIVQEDEWGRDYLIKLVITPVIPSLF
ncbi:MAG: hypothetical protein KMY53_06280 [Desulfarculus sp.]|nr:hypothetical protein [Pseudomonadota bacterium]MBV1716930.1 hypothetical protein [Desulfarculus sp.]MBU4574611.1 hypothetical protein [Pseudomonadota bacterium]MBU4596667.1 hypothetical protein [Pseudomonadota bacterium]MBV1737751.1 hypothetical protein [Desulfarculus sp.]